MNRIRNLAIAAVIALTVLAIAAWDQPATPGDRWEYGTLYIVIVGTAGGAFGWHSPSQSRVFKSMEELLGSMNLPTDREQDGLTKVLNGLGANGWELATVVTEPGSTYQARYIFKRPRN